jgi:hypothetical protein
MDLLQIVLSVVGCIGLAQGRYRWRALVNAVTNFRFPKNPRKLLCGCTTCVLSSGTELHRVNYSSIVGISKTSLNFSWMPFFKQNPYPLF